MIARSMCRSKRPLVQTSENFRRKFVHHNFIGCPNFSSLRQSVSQLKLKSRFHENSKGKTGRCWSSVALSREEATTEKSIEEQYSKKTPLEHVLLRPGMYVGPVERLPPNDVWVLEPLPQPYMFSPQQEINKKVEESSYRMVHKEYGLVPALIKVFDEILVNASDNRLRNPKSCTMLDVRIDPGEPGRRDPCIRVWNNGKGIPVQVS